MHELMHCYIDCYVSFQAVVYNEEILCHISANSHDIIHKIVEDYFKAKKEWNKNKSNLYNKTNNNMQQLFNRRCSKRG